MHQGDVLLGLIIQQSWRTYNWNCHALSEYESQIKTRCHDRFPPGRLWGLIRCDFYSLLIIDQQSLR